MLWACTCREKFYSLTWLFKKKAGIKTVKERKFQAEVRNWTLKKQEEFSDWEEVEGSSKTAHFKVRNFPSSPLASHFSVKLTTLGMHATKQVKFSRKD